MQPEERPVPATSGDPELADRLLLQLALWQDELAGSTPAERIEELVQLATRSVAGLRDVEPAALWAALESRLRAAEPPPPPSAPPVAEPALSTSGRSRSPRVLSPQDHADALIDGWASLTPDERESVQQALTSCGIAKAAPAPAARSASVAPRELGLPELTERLAALLPSLGPAEREGALRRLGVAAPVPVPPVAPAPVPGPPVAVELGDLDRDCFESVPPAAKRLSSADAGRLLCLLLNRIARLYVEASCTWEEGYKGEQKYASHRRRDDKWMASALKRVALQGDLDGFRRELDARLALVETELRNFRFLDQVDGGEPGVDCACLRELVQQLWPPDILKSVPRGFMSGTPNKEVAWDTYEARFKVQIGSKREPGKLLERLRVDVARRLAVDLINHESEAWEDPGGGSY